MNEPYKLVKKLAKTKRFPSVKQQVEKELKSMVVECSRCQSSILLPDLKSTECENSHGKSFSKF